ncbi:Inositol-tetrakisphosphate 1-kinase [Sciurus carolinensis]|uniref:Inositol-tetrakisphosphate 1-kinase n=1 Tax=Sciurus carolinensis TaxID=30640 RepID=A0AA41SUJ3_SCICA|nr:Inositol-tetrakisphosphate 1-kinase [Sciurus carolinensis]
MQTFLKGKRVGYWLSEKKIKKLNFQAFAELCRKRGIEVVQLNLSRPIEEQGPLDVIIHKLTDVILEADQNDSQSLELVHRFQEYIDAHPETIVLDPLPAIRTLLDRSKSYELIRKIEAYMKACRVPAPTTIPQQGERNSALWSRNQPFHVSGHVGTAVEQQHPAPQPVVSRQAGARWPSVPSGSTSRWLVAPRGSISVVPASSSGKRVTVVRPQRVLEQCGHVEQGQWTHVDDHQWLMKDDRICSPPFMELTSLCGDDTVRLLEKNGLAFPFICKTRVAHGTNSHEMAIVFNQEGLSAIQPPCVVQNFINHNAVLYKVFVVGESYTVVQRPSLKNFSAGTSDRESIFFNSHNVSKPESSSVLTELDKIEGVFERPSDEVIRELSRALRQALGVSLFGIDIIINNQTGQHAVIDINAFPGYEGVSEFFSDLLNHIATVLQGQSTGTATGDVVPLRHSRLPAEQAGSLAGEWTCGASAGCCGSVLGQDAPWTAEAEASAGGATKLPQQRLGCTAGVSPSFQQHCVASLATKASSQ